MHSLVAPAAKLQHLPSRRRKAKARLARLAAALDASRLAVHERVDERRHREDAADDGARRRQEVGERLARLAVDDLERRDLVVEEESVRARKCSSSQC